MDIIAHAEAKRAELQRELSRIETFLATAFELEHELGKVEARDGRNDAEKADAPKRKRASAVPGSGSATVQAVAEFVTEKGALSTKELLPLVRAKGIEVGGKDPLATLSARISGKGRVETRNGKWYLIGTSDAKASGEEAAENPAKDQSAASLFDPNQGEQHDAAPLAE